MRSFPAHKSRGQEVPPEVQEDFFFFFLLFRALPVAKGKMCLGCVCERGQGRIRRLPGVGIYWDDRGAPGWVLSCRFGGGRIAGFGVGKGILKGFWGF